MKLIDEVKRTIREHRLIEEGAAVVLGFSGGPDSLCLFDVLCGLREELKFSLYCVHVNHKLRPGAAEEDQAFCEDICAKRGVPCESFVYDCAAYAGEHGLTSEEAGRILRFSSFAETARRIAEGREEPKGSSPLPRIALAHNRNDQAETVLFRLLRGSGTDGLSGIEYKRRDESGFDIIRPLLDIDRRDIEGYCEERGLEPRIDHTNAEELYTRNKLRLSLIPKLREFNPNLEEALIRLSKTAAEDKEHLWQEAEGELSRLSGEAAQGCRGGDPARAELELAGLRSLSPAIRHRVLMLAFDRLGLVKDIGRKHLEAADRLIEKSATGASTDFPHGFKLAISYGKAVLSAGSKPSPSQDNEPCPAEEGVAAPEGGSAPEEGLVWRRRMPGDYIRVRLSKAGEEPERWGRKKIQDYMVDRKIPRDQRDKILLLCRGHEVLKLDRP